MLPKAEVVFESKSRMRLRFREKKRDIEFFEGLSQELSNLRDVDSVRWSPVTGSVMIEHKSSGDKIFEQASQNGLFKVTSRRFPGGHHEPLRKRIQQRFHKADKTVSRYTGGEIDIAYLGMIGLFGLGLYQAARGKLLPAGLTLLTYGYGMMSEPSEADD